MAEGDNYSLILPYDEPFRPQYHFTPDSMWMNDPNGLFYLDGVYHLYFQYHPYSTDWGPMHWGHASSTDLVHWKQHPIALYPDSLGTIFSGSAVVDRFNTAGFAIGKEIPVVAAFTIHSAEGLETQGIAYSNDKGMSWTKYEGNPVITNPGRRDFRDPKVFWFDKAQEWIMVFAVGNHVEFFRSADLKQWTYASSFGYADGSHAGTWECPDLYPLDNPASPGEQKWILSVSINNGGPNGGSGIQYFTGSFNGNYFRNDNPSSTVLWLDDGPDNYAGSSWSDIPAYDGRRIYIGWMANTSYIGDIPTTTWRGAQSLPREMRMVETRNGLRIASYPVEEVTSLYGKKRRTGPKLIKGQMNFEHSFQDLRQVRISCSFHADSLQFADSLALQLRSPEGDSLLVYYLNKSRILGIDRSACGDTSFNRQFTAKLYTQVEPGWEHLEIELYIDRSSVECFVNRGRSVLSCRIFPEGKLSTFDIFASDEGVMLEEASITEMNSIREDLE